MAAIQSVDPPSFAGPPALERPRWSARKGLLEIEVEFEDGRWLLRLSGELDLSNVSLLERELHTAEASFAERLVVDLSGLGFLDSSGLHALLLAERRSRRGRTLLSLVPGPRAVQEVFRLSGTEQELPFGSPPHAA